MKFIFKKTIITFFLFVFVLLRCWGQEYRTAKFEKLSLENGLSQSSVYKIVQDSIGFIWLATMDGLNRYDGYNFKVFKHDPLDSSSLSDNIITTIFIDTHGILWVGTYNGLNKFNSRKQIFERIEHQKENEESISSNNIRVIKEDFDGNLWIGTDKGLNKLNPETKMVTRYLANDKYKNFMNDQVRSIYIDKDNSVWVGTYYGLYRYDQKKDKFYSFFHNPEIPYSLSNNEVGAIYRDNEGTLWVGTDRGLNKYNRDVGEFFVYKSLQGNEFSISNNLIRDIFEDNSGNLWIATNKGLNKFIESKEEFLRFVHNPDNPFSISSNKVWSIFQDNSGIIWIGTLGGGINKLDNNRPNFIHYKKGTNAKNGLSNNSVWSIFEDDNGELWIGTDKGLDKYSENENLFSHVDLFDGQTRNFLVKAIAKDGENLWIGTDKGLIKYNPKNQSAKYYKHDKNDSNSLSDNIIKAIIIDKEGLIWIGTKSSGLTRFNPQTEKFTHFKQNKINDNSLSHNRIWSLYEDEDGSIWVGTFGGGLNRLNKENDNFEHFLHKDHVEGSISNNIIRAIYRDSNKRLWIGTSNGLNLLQPEANTFKVYTTAHGLPNEMIYAIEEDDNKNLWLSTNRGLSKFNPETETFRNYDAKDGLQSYEFNQGASFKSKTGEMFFGGINGLNSFSPENMSDNEFIPPVVFTDFKILNKSVAIGTDSELSENINFTDHLTLSYKDYVFSFEFAALNFTNPEKNRYKYKMDGFEDEWNEIGTRRYANYTNLDHGTYTFIVAASNNDGKWNEVGKRIKITITPPFWKTNTFYVSLIVFIILSIIVYIKLRERKLIREKSILEERVRERTAEILEQKEEIESQRDDIKIKNQQITDSIRYAQKIQQAILPSNKEIKSYFPESFVFFRPKDIVSGDFYWFDQKGDIKFFAAVDCTGHGVPGAFMSLIGHSLLDEAINKQNLVKPAEILEFLHQGILKIFKHKDEGNEQQVKDGMDLALCAYDVKDSLLQYSGAYNPLYLFRNNELIEYKGDIKPIGDVGIYKTGAYTNHSIEIHQGDMVYLFSDGYIDQFGGKNHEKFMKKPFKDKLFELHKVKAATQKNLLQETYDNWKGNKMQIDDVLVIGVKF